MFNSISIYGKVTSTVIYSVGESGRKSASFYMFISATGGKTILVNVRGSDADIAKSVKKGDKVFVQGTLDYKEVYEAEIGKKHKDFFIAARHLGCEKEVNNEQ